MSREIKFRAFDLRQHKMIYFFNPVMMNIENSLNFLFCNNFYDLWYSKCKRDSIGLEHFEIMQYTGLKDKNGNEIYEGDIVSASWYDYEEPRDDTFGEIVFNEALMAYCIWDERDKTISEMNGQGAYYWEIGILGNIYENPELLEVE